MKDERFIRKNNNEAKNTLKEAVKVLHKQIMAEDYENAAMTTTAIMIGIGTVNAANDILSDI